MHKQLFMIAAVSVITACNSAPDGGRDAAAVPSGAVAGGDTAAVTPGPETPGAEVPDGTAATEFVPGPGVTDAARNPSGSATDVAAPASAPRAAASAAPDAATQPATQPSAADEGAAVLRRASAAYENVRSLQAEFEMNFENPLLRQRLTSRGTIYQRQPDRLALRFTDPAGDLIVSDGQYFWIYYPSNNAQQVTRAPAAAAGQSAVNLQAQFVGNPVERFSHTLEGAESVGGRQAQVLTLVPRQRAEYRSLKVWIDNRDSLVRRFEITEHNGSVRRFDLQKMQVNPAIPDAVFRFTPPDGVRVVSPG
jgi:outer membrane lipoprotein carrier protein